MSSTCMGDISAKLLIFMQLVLDLHHKLNEKTALPCWLVKIKLTEVELRTNLQSQGQGLWKSSRPRPRIELPRTGCLEAKDRKARGQGLEDMFENARKYKCKPCNYNFTGI